MSLNNALEFIDLVKNDESFRHQCYNFSDIEELMEMLQTNNKGFNTDDFENAINMNLVKCQTYEQAEVFKDIENWFKLFSY